MGICWAANGLFVGLHMGSSWAEIGFYQAFNGSVGPQMDFLLGTTKCYQLLGHQMD